MEDYLLSSSWTPRPRTSTEMTEKAWDKRFPTVGAKAREIVTTMKKVKTTDAKTGHWPLDVDSLNPWCGPKSLKKNMTRDFSKYAYASVIEEIIIAGYRPEMFRVLPQSVMLRHMILMTLRDALITTPTIAKGKNNALTLGVSTYSFPDGINTYVVARTVIDIADLITKRHRWSALGRYHQETQDIIRMVECKDVAAAIPGGKTMAVAVYNKLTELQEVGGVLIRFSSILLPLIDLCPINIGVRYTRRSTGDDVRGG